VSELIFSITGCLANCWTFKVPPSQVSRDSRVLNRTMLILGLPSGINSGKIKTTHFRISPPTLQILLVLATRQLCFLQYVNVQADHFKVARNISREAITLLKNANNTLPLSTSDTLKIFGSDAENNPAGPNACSERVRLSATFSSLYESCGSCAALKRVLLWNDSGVCSGTFLNQQMLTGDSLGLQHWYSRDGLGKW
jgi:beta-glucosidase-like glycosyl hydrolase